MVTRVALECKCYTIGLGARRAEEACACRTGRARQRKPAAPRWETGARGALRPRIRGVALQTS